jgi:hypothetical protein
MLRKLGLFEAGILHYGDHCRENLVINRSPINITTWNQEGMLRVNQTNGKSFNTRIQNVVFFLDVAKAGDATCLRNGTESNGWYSNSSEVDIVERLGPPELIGDGVGKRGGGESMLLMLSEGTICMSTSSSRGLPDKINVASSLGSSVYLGRLRGGIGSDLCSFKYADKPRVLFLCGLRGNF